MNVNNKKSQMGNCITNSIVLNVILQWHLLAENLPLNDHHIQ